MYEPFPRCNVYIHGSRPSLARPKISEVVQDTKVLLQQSREKLVITCVTYPFFLHCPILSIDWPSSRIANDLSSYDTTKYKVTVMPNNTTGTPRFHLGEPISVRWQAPQKHSRKDWIGLYRVRGFCHLLHPYCGSLLILGWGQQVQDSH
jgi:hypothetical protein